jgi:protein arginine N-methyltransferase 1
MYTIADYGAMIADRARTDAFARALAGAIAPGAVVLDIGTGTGIFALLACRTGARRVYALEPEDVIEVARQIAAANGCADRIEFIQAQSTRVTLPERVDVIVSDIGGVLPWFQGHVPAIVDARRRLLAPHGVIIPRRDVAWAAVVEAAELYERHTRPWADNAYGLDMNAARQMVVNTWTRSRVAGSQLLTGVERWATVDYAVVEDPDVRAEVSWVVRRAGTGHGVAAGFDRTVAEGIVISSAPDAPDAMRPGDVYGTVFFPWPEPVPLAPGERVTVGLDARFIRNDYVWNWTTRIEDGTRPTAVRARFSQSTFYGSALALPSLRCRAAHHVPTLNEDGRIAHAALELMRGSAPLGDIAREVRASFPSRFPRFEDALAFVGDLSCRFAR